MKSAAALTPVHRAAQNAVDPSTTASCRSNAALMGHAVPPDIIAVAASPALQEEMAVVERRQYLVQRPRRLLRRRALRRPLRRPRCCTRCIIILSLGTHFHFSTISSQRGGPAQRSGIPHFRK